MTTSLLFSLLLLPPALAPDQPLRLADGARVVLVGDTLIEREQASGWWELALTTRFPGAKIQVRNLGWSGDTVFGDARAGFGTPADGFKALVEHTLALKPTLIVLGYGRNESFAGPDGLPAFRKGLETLLDRLAPSKAPIVLLSPLRQGDMGRPLPEPTVQNRNLRLYADILRDVATKRGLRFVDLYDLFGDLGKAPRGVTENGIHLTERGYRWSAPRLESALGWDDRRLVLDLKPGASGVSVVAPQLPLGDRTVVVRGLPAGAFTLTVDGKPAATADAKAWAQGVVVASPEAEQVAKLRRAIIAKNELYFHRWRPQNVTYLFGFRKHEQGQNAREIPQFDPLVAARESEIADLARPTAHLYGLKPAR
ncbi:MAG: SGNH/GDSL hydrolase family protein [Gemmataceae bacterium]